MKTVLHNYEQRGTVSYQLAQELIEQLSISCETCGRPAHYRFGLIGFCSKHRATLDETRKQWRRTTLEAGSAAIDDALNTKDQQLRTLDALRRVRKTRRTKG